jgi:glycosyltransferase involved in cell wall biosynthesis
MKFLVAQIGARMHYAVPRILWKLQSLERLCTDIASIRWVRKCTSVLVGVGMPGIRRLSERVPYGVPEALVQHFPALGLTYKLRIARAQTTGEKAAVSLWAAREFGRRVVQAGFGNAAAVYVLNGAGQEILGAAACQGRYKVLEQISAPRGLYDRLYNEEVATWPGWEALPNRDELADEVIAREQSEWQLADKIVCGSQFVNDSLIKGGQTAGKCTVVPYGVDLQSESPQRREDGGSFNVLFCGRVSLMKGVPYLATALRTLNSKHIRCRMAGEDLSARTANGLKNVAELLGVVPRSEMSRLYAWAHVFVLPTLCEGSATVCYEALAAGLPVITTPNAGSVVRDGVDGFVVPIRDSEALAAGLERLAVNRALYEQMSHNAFSRSLEFTVDQYASRLGAALGLTAQQL